MIQCSTGHLIINKDAVSTTLALPTTHVRVYEWTDRRTLISVKTFEGIEADEGGGDWKISKLWAVNDTMVSDNSEREMIEIKKLPLE